MEHYELVEEMRLVEHLPLTERIKLIKKRRKQQVNNYLKWIKQESSQTSPATHRHPTKVFFTHDVTLIDLASRNDSEGMKALLQTDVNPDASNHDGLTALHQCCIDGSEALVTLLMNAGADVNAKDQDQWTPLHAAATCGHFRVVMMLVQAGADLIALNSDGDLPYDITEDEVTLQYLENEMLKQGITDEIIEEKRISEEVQMHHDIETMLQAGQSLDMRGKVGETMLHVAVANGYNSVVRMLLENHASVNLEDQDKWQPVHAAAYWNNLEALELLVNHNANLRALTKFRETPLDLSDDPNIKAHILQMIDDRPELYALKSSSSYDSFTDKSKDNSHPTQNPVEENTTTDNLKSNYSQPEDNAKIKLKESSCTENDTSLNTVLANPIVNKSALELSTDRRNSMREAKSKAPLIRGNCIKEHPKPQSPDICGFISSEPMMPPTLESNDTMFHNKENEKCSTYKPNLLAKNKLQSTTQSGSNQTQRDGHHTNDTQKFTNDLPNNETQSTDAVTDIQSQTLETLHTANPQMNSQTQWTNPLAKNNSMTNPPAQKMQSTNTYVIGKSDGINSLSNTKSLSSTKDSNSQQPITSLEYTPLLTNPLVQDYTKQTNQMAITQSQPLDSSSNEQSQSTNSLLMKQTEPCSLNSNNVSQQSISPNSHKHPENSLVNDEQQTDPHLNSTQLSCTIKDNPKDKSSTSYNHQTVAEESQKTHSTFKKQPNGYPSQSLHEKEPVLGTPKKLRPSPKSHRAPDPPKGTLLDLKRQRQHARTLEDSQRYPHSSFNPGVPSNTQRPLSSHEFSALRPRSSSEGMNSTGEKRHTTAKWNSLSNANTFNPPPSPTAIRYSFKSNPSDYILGPSIIKREKKCIIM